ncbi:hypothetical protein [Planctobacterium marinum]|uniref:Poly-gamma-glutamate synthase PgsB n=1 Tax=Planctobacterium marinum TaxID=1631968 RepID=A0AA48KT11_9ALTE|nr:hypothetical protein MACH26_04310 [Planctobacterium marinum]
MANNSSYQKILATGLSAFWQRAYRQYLTELAQKWQQNADNNLPPDAPTNLIKGIRLLSEHLNECGVRLDSLRSRYRIFHTEISQETSETGRRELLLEFCQYLGSSNLRNDRKALKRYLDEDAVTERWQSRLKDQEYFASFLMGRISALFDLLAFSAAVDKILGSWQELTVEALLTPWIRYSSEPKVQLAAFKSLSSMLTSLHSQDPHILSSELLRYTYRFSLDKEQQPELQIEALNLLAVADINKAINLIDTRINREDEQDQIFFRAAIADVISLHYLNKPEIFELTEQLIQDPSPTVRQSVIRVLPVCDDEKKITSILLRLSKDESDAVYCYLVSQLPYIQHSQLIFAFILNELKRCSSLIRFKALCRGLVSLVGILSGSAKERVTLEQRCNEVLNQVIASNDSPRLQYLALEARERVWAILQSDLKKALSPLLKVRKKSVALNQEQQKILSSDNGKRWLAANIGHRFTIQVQKQKILNDTRMGFRLWRFIYEFRHPATDKRQHHSHVTGRLYQSHDIIPSGQLAEVSQTTVPGEPLHMAEEGHWRPFLPLLDQVISALQKGLTGKVTTLYHVAGKTEITPPKSLFKNLMARLKLSFRFKYFAELRNRAWDSDAPDRYVRELEKLGIGIKCNGYPVKSDAATLTQVPAVSRFFDIAVPITVIQFYQDFQRYFVSVYQNTIQHILLFSLFMLALFWGNHALLGQRIKSARKQIPITIGGWGTRGKSGTERLKSALVNSVGLATMSKTTGCEAMFLYATRYGQLQEMFLFRPYDKATIWEQTFVTRLAAKLKADTLCWECMGLTPRYIDILQQQWMQDDMVTITNCFPDHEDLQGPAGIDVPQVIAKFIPQKSKVWTSEENMLAYLEKEAIEKNAQLTPVDWLEIATIPEDLLERFPYQEHPANIALVAKMAEEMQMSRIMAIKEMADRVVPDIGVLQVFPYTEVAGRTMRFINGMSANERYGALANWERLGYTDRKQQLSGDLQLVTVINNRADRVPRSKVFARLIAFDFSARVHFVIGNNLNGFQQFAEEAFAERLESNLNIAGQPQEYVQQFQSLLRFLLLPVEIEQLENYLQKLCAGQLPPCAGDIGLIETKLQEIPTTQLDSSTKTHAQSLLRQFSEAQTLLQNLSSEDQITATSHKTVTEFLTDIFVQKIQLVDDYHISGNELNMHIAQHIPGNIQTDILGLQNIKGPGLDFVYSWQQWQKVQLLTRTIETQYGEALSQSLKELASLPVYSHLDRNAVEQCIAILSKAQSSLHEDSRYDLEKIRKNLLQEEDDKTPQVEHNRIWQFFLHQIEEVFDVFDAVLRGRKAKQILIDLAAQRISLKKAAWMLKILNKRQKGGWLGR